MAYSQNEVRTRSASWAVAAVFLLQVIATLAVLLAQTLGWEKIAYNLGIVIEIPLIFYSILADATGIPFLDIMSSFVLGVLFVAVVYFLVAVVVGLPIHAIYRAIQRAK